MREGSPLSATGFGSVVTSKIENLYANRCPMSIFYCKKAFTHVPPL